jgi:hypothetical protein
MHILHHLSPPLGSPLTCGEEQQRGEVRRWHIRRHDGSFPWCGGGSFLPRGGCGSFPARRPAVPSPTRRPAASSPALRPAARPRCRFGVRRPDLWAAAGSGLRVAAGSGSTSLSLCVCVCVCLLVCAVVVVCGRLVASGG